jgi:hypothetical protein
LFTFTTSTEKSSTTSLHLASLKFLSTLTGGSLRLYTPETTAFLTRDIVKLFRGPHAYRGVLRVRTSNTFKVKAVYGAARADPTQPDLFHIPHCNQFTTLCFDLEHTHSSGLVTECVHLSLFFLSPLSLCVSHTLSSDPQQMPTVQIAFAFASLEPSSSSLKECMRLQRRVVVHTLQAGVAYQPPDLYESANLDAVLTLLLHKVRVLPLSFSLSVLYCISANLFSLLLFFFFLLCLLSTDEYERV